MLLKSILISIIMLNYFACCLISEDICIKKIECENNKCYLSKCKGRIGYDNVIDWNVLSMLTHVKTIIK